MPGLLASMLAIRRRRPSADLPVPATIDVADEPTDEIVRMLCDRIDRAERLGLRSYGDRLLDEVGSLTAANPTLAERVGRVHLRRDRPERALAVLDGCRRPTESLRLLRVVTLLACGRRLDAQCELRQWSRSRSAPVDVRHLLTILDWEEDRLAEASSHHGRDVAEIVDHDALALVLLLALERGQVDGVDAIARRLQRLAPRGTRRFDHLLSSLGVAGPRDALPPAAVHVRSLATELVAAEPAIPGLVESLAIEPDPCTARLLAEAIELALPDLADAPAAMAELARLQVLLDEPATARRWVQRAADERPYDAALALLAADLGVPRPAAAPAFEATPVEAERVQAA